MTRAAARTNTVNASGGGGGTVNDGVLQIQGGVPISGSLLPITDQIGNLLPIKVSATEVAFDVNVGIGGAPSASYGLYVQSSSGTVLANRYHFASDRYLDGSGVTFPTATNYTFSMGGVNQLIINNTNVVANNSIGFGTAGTPPSIGSYLTSGYSSNGEYMRLYSGHNAQYALANYQFNVANRTFNNASVLSGTVASIIDIPSHTFSITDAGAANINYRGISLAYTINNSVTSNGIATGLRMDATITNANSMLHRGIYYGISGVSSNTRISGIELINTDVATSGNQRFSPSLILGGSGWKTNATAGAQTVLYDIYVAPQQFSTLPLPVLNFDCIINGVRTTIFSLGGTSGIVYNVNSISGLNHLITLGNSSLGGGNAIGLTALGSSLTNNLVTISTSQTITGTSVANMSGLVVLPTFNPTSGSLSFSALTYSGTINQTGGANGITRGLWINPTITAAADFRAIDVEQGRVFLKNLRTTAGSSGELWNDGGTIKIS